MKSGPLRLHANWDYGRSDARRYYLVEVSINGERVGLAHGWYEAGARFTVEKIELAAEHRSQGHGTAVIQMLRMRARESGCTELAFQGVRADNLGAIRLYEALGARLAPTSGDLYDFVLSPP